VGGWVGGWGGGGMGCVVCVCVWVGGMYVLIMLDCEVSTCSFLPAGNRCVWVGWSAGR